MNIESFYKRFGRNTSTNFELIRCAKDLEIPNFYVCMRDEIKRLPRNKTPLNVVTNIHTSSERGVHWSAFHLAKNKQAFWFDSFALPPTQEVLDFIPSEYSRLRNTFEVQSFGQTNCGQLCLFVLYKLNQGVSFHDVIISLYKK